jgi:L-seryl-tRNA(Ser) seleniumtransferase
VNYRDLPSVDELLRETELNGVPREFAVRTVRRVLDRAREEIRSGHEPEDVRAAVAGALARFSPALKRVINATGVVLHTNLGRAPLPEGSLAGYSNLEYDLAAGKRGKRDVHASTLIDAACGAPGIVVNNNAAAVFLVLHELAAGREVIISRGELIEIGDGFRIPDIMARSGAIIREVGTTNKTALADYRAAICERTGLILRVHPSNFHIEGFTAKPELRKLADLAHESSLPLYEDLGSGCIADLKSYGIDEPVVAASVAAGVGVVSFSGDKLLGGPQAGVIAGRADLIERIRANPLYRMLRPGKTVYAQLAAALHATLCGRWEQVPALAMIVQTAEEIRSRAERLAREIGAEVVESRSVIGGGSTPNQSLPTWAVSLRGDAVQLDRRLRAGATPVIGRIEGDRLLLDLRTVFQDEEEELAAMVKGAMAAGNTASSSE